MLFLYLQGKLENKSNYRENLEALKNSVDSNKAPHIPPIKVT